MKEKQKAGLLQISGKDVRFDCPMKRYTTLRVGGNAEAFVTVRERDKLGRLISFLSEEKIPWLVIGGGSNLLIRDRGIRGVVILLRGGLASLVEGEDGESVLAGGGTPIRRLLASIKKRGLSGLEFLAGIPGTAGGAVAMNAGAWGEEVKDRVRRIEIMDRMGREVMVSRPEMLFSYRKLSLPEGSIILKVDFQLMKEDPDIISTRIAAHLKERREKQPLPFPNAGSIFKNPPGDFAGRLIEQAGMKGKKLGGAMISPKHANIIVNTGRARAADILGLMEMAQRAVRDSSGVELEAEIRVVGEDDPWGSNKKERP